MVCALVLAAILPCGFDPQQALAAGCSSSTMYVVAHQDDSLLFQSPDLLHDIQSGACVTTVFLTAGNNGLGPDYWGERERGALAAYAEMAGLPDDWAATTTTAAGHSVLTQTLVGAPGVRQLFMRLQVGYNPQGETLESLWYGTTTEQHPVDGTPSYTARGVVEALASLMTTFQPTIIRIQDYLGRPGGGDHVDHYLTAWFARAAQHRYLTPHVVVSYLGYPVNNLAFNVSGPDLAAKQLAFLTYAPHDFGVCQNATACAGTLEDTWLHKQYVAATFASQASNTPPVAVAEQPQVVQGGSLVQLDGRASSDPDGDLLSYHWSQVSGSPVVLTSPTSATPFFTAPSSESLVLFSLVVDDGRAASDTASGTAASLAIVAVADTTPPKASLASVVGVSAQPQRIRIEWSTRDDTSGVAAVDMRWRRRPVFAKRFSRWSTPVQVTGTSTVVTGAAGHDYCFQVRAVDRAGNPSAWSSSRCTSIPIDVNGLRRSDGWGRGRAESWIGGSFLVTSHAGATLWVNLRHVTRIGVIGTTCPQCGSLDVFQGSRRLGRLSLRSRVYVGHGLTLLPRWARPVSGQIRLIAVKNGRTVRLDAISVEQSPAASGTP